MTTDASMTHYWQTVDGWFNVRPGNVGGAFDRMLADLPRDRPSVFVQVGTWMGRGTAYLGVEIVNHKKPVTLVAVDHFQGSAEIARHPRAAGLVRESEAAFRHNVQPVAVALGPRFQIRVRDSAAAADDFEDDSVDAVWIDAAHGYDYVMRDVAAWRAKVRRGGLLGGDDFARRCPGVEQAVTEHFSAAAGVPGTVYWLVRRQADGSYTPMGPA